MATRYLNLGNTSMPVNSLTDFTQSSGTTSFSSSTDGSMVVLRYRNFTLSGGTITTSARCRGLCIIVEGDCYINGTITMSSRGANVGGYNMSMNTTTLGVESNTNYSIQWITGSGGGGGSGRSDQYLTGYAGSAGSNGNCGGGGGGGTGYNGKSGSGSAGTVFSGGAGGGGGDNGTGRAGGANGGAGGNGTSGGGGGGAGNPGGWAAGSPNYSGSTGIGGLIIIIVRGSLTIGGSGYIVSNGTAGGSGWGGGGGSGGGSITLIYGSSYSNSGTIQANGGSGGTGTSGCASGGAGGAGSIRVFQSSIAFTALNDTNILPMDLKKEITRWIHYGNKTSYKGNFDKPLDSSVTAGCTVKIDNSWYKISSISSDRTLENAVTLNTLVYTGKVNMISAVTNYQNNLITIAKGISGNFYGITKNHIDISDLSYIASCYIHGTTNIRIAFSPDMINSYTWDSTSLSWILIDNSDVFTKGLTISSLNAFTELQLTKLWKLSKQSLYLNIGLISDGSSVCGLDQFYLIGGSFSTFPYNSDMMKINGISVDTISTIL